MKRLCKRYIHTSIIIKFTISIVLGVAASFLLLEKISVISLLEDLLIPLLQFLIIPLMLFRSLWGLTNPASIDEAYCARAGLSSIQNTAGGTVL